MLTIALVSSKGGVGKSTLAVNLATCAVDEGDEAIIIDLDPQESAAAWSTIRGDRTPHAVAGLPKNLEKMLTAARSASAAVAFIDTQGHASQTGAIAARHADIVIVPCRSSAADVLAMRDTVRLLEHADALGKAVAVIYAPNARSREISEAEAALDAIGLTVLHPPIIDRKEYRDAYRDGEGVTESAPGSQAAEEIRALWAAIKAYRKARAKREKTRV